MVPSRESLKETFGELSDEELLRRCTSGELTEEAHAIAAHEARERGLELPRIVESEEREREYLGEWVTIARYLSYMEVNLLRSCLESAGIPAIAADAQTIQTDALLTPAMRGASLRVPAEYAAEAREVVEAFKRGDFELSEQFEPNRP